MNQFTKDELLRLNNQRPWIEFKNLCKVTRLGEMEEKPNNFHKFTTWSQDLEIQELNSAMSSQRAAVTSPQPYKATRVSGK